MSSANDYTYDSDRNLLQDKYYSGIDLFFVTDYYPNGKQKQYEWYLSGNLYEITYYEYDDEWNSTAQEVYDADGVLKSRIEYDSLGNKAVFYEYSYGELRSETLYEYYDDNWLSNMKTKTVRYYSNGELDYYTVTDYNEDEEIRSTVYYNADGTAR